MATHGVACLYSIRRFHTAPLTDVLAMHTQCNAPHRQHHTKHRICSYRVSTHVSITRVRGLIQDDIPRLITLPSIHHSPITVNKNATVFTTGTVRLSSTTAAHPLSATSNLHLLDEGGGGKKKQKTYQPSPPTKKTTHFPSGSAPAAPHTADSAADPPRQTARRTPSPSTSSAAPRGSRAAGAAAGGGPWPRGG